MFRQPLCGFWKTIVMPVRLIFAIILMIFCKKEADTLPIKLFRRNAEKLLPQKGCGWLLSIAAQICGLTKFC